MSVFCPAACKWTLGTLLCWFPWKPACHSQKPRWQKQEVLYGTCEELEDGLFKGSSSWPTVMVGSWGSTEQRAQTKAGLTSSSLTNSFIYYLVLDLLSNHQCNSLCKIPSLVSSRHPNWRLSDWLIGLECMASPTFLCRLVKNFQETSVQRRPVGYILLFTTALLTAKPAHNSASG